MSSAKEIKSQVIAEIKEKISASKALVVVDYNGISVANVTQLRSNCRAADVEYKVYKNRLVLKAMEELNIDGFASDLEGTTAIAFAKSDALAAAKVISEATKTIKTLKVKSGLMDGARIDATIVAKLASIPSKEVLLAQLLGMLQSPISGLARALQQIAEKNA